MARHSALRDFPHLEFRRCWKLNERTLLNLGRCDSLVNAMGDLPLPPELQRDLRQVSFERGAQATTAIEGNTLTDQELREVLQGKKLPASRGYQAQEVTNVLGLMNQIWSEVVRGNSLSLVTPQMLSSFNREIGKNLGPLYDGAPGKWRADRRHVGRYLTPPPETVKSLVEEFCQWLRAEFRFESQTQVIPDAIVQAVVAHVYFEWIHPFADGNGRTGRMLEFYILLRAGLPDTTAHVLANHYNDTRTEYAAHFENARQKRSLTEFLDYAVQGLVDGLAKAWDKVQFEVFKVCWEAFVYRTFSEVTYRKRTIFKRRRTLALAMPLERSFTLVELIRSRDDLTAAYMGKDLRGLKEDFAMIVELGLAEPDPSGAERFRATTAQLRAQQIPGRVTRSRNA